MKKTILASGILLSLLVASISAVSAQPVIKQKLKDQIVGIWAYHGIVIHDNGKGFGDNKFRSNTPVSLKVISKDGTYTSLMFSPRGPIITGSGTYKITSDTTYVEQVGTQMNSTMVGKSNTMVVHFSPNGDAMSSKFLLQQLSTGDNVNVETTEYWERVEMPNPMRQPSDLNTKQKVEGVIQENKGDNKVSPANDRGEDRHNTVKNS